MSDFDQRGVFRTVVLEGALVAAIGVVVAFTANALSPRGIKLTRDYFPGSPTPVQVASNYGTNALSGTNRASPIELLAQRLKEKGLQTLNTAQLSELVRDPRFQQGLILLIDARDTSEYEKGHIPGAYECYYYRPENYLPALLPLCQVAEQIVVYCNGGDCEDSQFAAIFLRDSASVPKEKLFVYLGGLHDWATNNLPVEIGVRNSGNVLNPR